MIPTTHALAKTKARRITLSYGPFTVPAARSSTEPGHFSVIGLPVRKPVNQGYITRMQASLSAANGTTEGLMLHHMVLSNAKRVDPVIPQFPQRFFASGHERTPVILPEGYGYYVDNKDIFWGVFDLMNSSGQAKQAYVKSRSTFFPASGWPKATRTASRE